jgi:NADH:ubiquinone oxidoreductase subunit F (NADH-binding)
MDPFLLSTDETLARLERAGLRGRGGGWFPTFAKWRAVRVEGGAPAVIGNGAEGEPGSLKDRYTMLRRPDDVLRGLALAARTLGAREATVYLKGTFAHPAAALERSLSERPITGGPVVRVHRGEDAYVAGEETALLESLEGRRAWPRPKPPLPYAVGLAGRPTLVQNVETLARVEAALADPEAFRRDERTLVTLWGRVRRPGVYEVALGTPLARVIEEQGGGVVGRLRVILPAGPSAAPLLARDAETPLEPDALRRAGSSLGTAAIFVADDSMCPLAVAASVAAFFEREACGQCPPCVVGTQSLSRILRAVENGEARARDVAVVREVAGFMSDHGYCAHGRTAAASAVGFLAKMPEVVEAHLALRRCPEGLPVCDPFGADSPERAAVEATLDGGASA